MNIYAVSTLTFSLRQELLHIFCATILWLKAILCTLCVPIGCLLLTSFSLFLLFLQPSFRCRNCICPMTHRMFVGTSLIKINYDLVLFVVDFPYFWVSWHSFCMGEERMKERSSQDSPNSLFNSPDSERRTHLSWLLQRASGSFVSLLQHEEHPWPIGNLLKNVHRRPRSPALALLEPTVTHPSASLAYDVWQEAPFI